MDNQCRFCKVYFKTPTPEKHVCDGCKEELTKILKEDKDIRYDFLDTVIGDDIVVERIAKSIFKIPVRSLGIGGDGTLAEFFRDTPKTTSEG